MKTAAIILLMMLICMAGRTQESTNLQSKVDDFFEKIDSNSSEQEMMPVKPTTELDEETHARYLEALSGYYDYRISGYEHRKKVFYWQLLSSKITFVVVILLVLCGMYFSGVQFHHSLKQTGKTGVAEEKVTEISASMEGVKVSSSVLGVIILIISFLFFYLYLVYVYPIKEIL